MDSSTQVVSTLSSLIEAGKFAGAVSLSEIEVAIQQDEPLSEEQRAAVRAYLDEKYQVMTSNNDAETTMWRVR